MSAIKGFRRSSSFVMASLFAMSLLFILAWVMYFIVIGSDETLMKESEEAISADIRMFKESESLHDMDYLKRVLEHRLQDPESSYFYALRSPNGKLSMGNIKTWPEKLEAKKQGLVAFEIPHEELVMPSESSRVMSEHYDIMAKIHTFENGYSILVGRDVDDLEIAQYVALTFGWVVIAIVVVLAVGFFVIGGFVVSRVNTISTTADEIMQTGNLSKRIPVTSKWDDLSRLANVLNRMFDEMESSVATMKRVTDNIAHDLRTPLTRLRTDLSSVKDKKQREELLKEADTLLTMFNGLLRIAEIETAEKRSGFSRMALHDIAKDAEELYHPLADEKGISINSLIKPCHITGDRDLMFQCFANIIDNAIKFTPDGGNVTVTLEKDAKHITFSVKDSGPGIAEKHQEEVFRRFFRADESRHTPGHGLGLSIVKAVVALHHGDIRLENTQSGLSFSVLLPI